MFFESGRSTHDHPELTAQTLRAGHVIGAQTWDPVIAHPETLAAKSAEEQVSRGLHSVELACEVAPESMRLIRLPSAIQGDILKRYLSDRNLVTIDSDIDTNDWRYTDPKALVQHTVQAVEHRGRGVIELHDGLKQTAVMLPSLLDQLRARGYQTVVFVPR